MPAYVVGGDRSSTCGHYSRRLNVFLWAEVAITGTQDASPTMPAVKLLLKPQPKFNRCVPDHGCICWLHLGLVACGEDTRFGADQRPARPLRDGL